jgi:hypothetical protein
MRSGELALALVSSSHRARTSTDAVGDDAVAQPARRPDSSNRATRIILPVVAEPRGSIVCSFRLCAARNGDTGDSRQAVASGV